MTLDNDNQKALLIQIVDNMKFNVSGATLAQTAAEIQALRMALNNADVDVVDIPQLSAEVGE